MRAVILVGALALLAAGCDGLKSAHGICSGGSRPSASERVRAARDARDRNFIGGVMQADAKTASLEDPGERLDAMRTIDLSDCPGDFREAYLAHIEAWRRLMEAERDLAKSAERSANASPEAGPDLAPRQARDLSRAAKAAREHVRTSFARVKTIAASYDPPSCCGA